MRIDKLIEGFLLTVLKVNILILDETTLVASICTTPYFMIREIPYGNCCENFPTFQAR